MESSQWNWKKLELDLEGLSVKNPNSLLDILAQINGVLDDRMDADQILKKIDLGGAYELRAKTESLLETKRFEALNNFFFQEKEFQYHCNNEDKNHPRYWLLSDVIENRQGSPLVLTLIYLHLCVLIDLPIYLISNPNHNLLKWVRSGYSSYVDLSQQGQILTEEEILEKLPQWSSEGEDEEDQFEILPAKVVLTRYLNKLITLYRNQHDLSSLKVVLDICLKIDRDQVKYLGDRALIYKQLGDSENALKDFKRFFHFVEETQAPPELLAAFKELDSKEFSTVHNHNVTQLH